MMNFDRNISCCFSGHRKTHFDIDTHFMRKILKKTIDEAMNQDFQIFYSGMAMGFDIIAAEAVLERKHAKLVGVIPFYGQEMKWSAKWRTRHDKVLRGADKIIVLNENYVRGCYHQRNRYLVDHSHRLICFCGNTTGGTAQTISYAEKAGIEIVNIWQDLQAGDKCARMNQILEG